MIEIERIFWAVAEREGDFVSLTLAAVFAEFAQ